MAFSPKKALKPLLGGKYVFDLLHWPEFCFVNIRASWSGDALNGAITPTGSLNGLKKSDWSASNLSDSTRIQSPFKIFLFQMFSMDLGNIPPGIPGYVT